MGLISREPPHIYLLSAARFPFAFSHFHTRVAPLSPAPPRRPRVVASIALDDASMSQRHHPRQPDRERERDVHLHDPHAAHHSHSLPPPPHALAHPPHMNGNGVPTPPGPLSGPSGHAPGAQMVSPPILSSALLPNGVPVMPSIQKLAHANEQTWLLIGN